MASLAEPLDLPNGVRLPNRIAKAALSEDLGDRDNSPDERIITLYRRWAQGGYGLEARAVRVIRPALWRPVSALRGILNPALDTRFTKDRQILDVLAHLDARPTRIPSRPARRKQK